MLDEENLSSLKFARVDVEENVARILIYVKHEQENLVNEKL